MSFEIRAIQDSDLSALADIYRDSIISLGNDFYTPEQIAAWASFPDDIEAFRKWVTAPMTLVAIKSDGKCVGFGGLEDSGRISALFVLPESMRKGVGSALLKKLVSEAQLRGVFQVTTEASEFSKPLFEKFGFRVKNIEKTEFKEVAFTRYAMQLRI